MGDTEFCRLLSKKIREYRRAAGLTQEQFGNAVGLTGRRVRDIESGKAKGLSLSSLIRISEFIGCELCMVEKNNRLREAERNGNNTRAAVFDRIAGSLTRERQEGWEA